MRWLIGLLAIIAVGNLAAHRNQASQTNLAMQANQAMDANQATQARGIDAAANLKDFQAIEFRRYTIKPGGRENFTRYFETYFPGAIEQAGAITAGSFHERKNQNGFTWIRGFHTMEARPVANAAFYSGPVWKEHRKTANDLIDDSDNVMLLGPLSAERGIPILPDVDPVTEEGGAQGVVVAQIFAVRADSVEAFAKDAEPAFAAYRAAGARDAGVLVTLEVKNNYPQLPVRADGPYLVWLGILKDNQMLETQFTPAAERSLPSFTASGLLRGAPETVVLDPTPRSRLRWLP
jgi:NIPSNAP protein